MKMEKEKKIDSFGLRIASIKTLKYTQSELLQEFNSDTDSLISFETTVGFKVLPEVKKITCLIKVNLNIQGTNEEFSQLDVEYTFDVIPFDEVVKKNGENQYNILDTVIDNIVDISTSTTRGILFEKLKGTIAQKEIYPLVNFSKSNKEEDFSNPTTHN